MKGDRDQGSKNSNFKDQNRSQRLSRNDTRRVSYPDDRYSLHLECVHSYLEAPSHHYSGVSSSNFPYSALDDVPRYVDLALRNLRARLDYDVSAGAGAGTSLYGGDAYGPIDRAPQAGYSGHGSSIQDLKKTLCIGKSTILIEKKTLLRNLNCFQIRSHEMEVNKDLQICETCGNLL